LCGRDGVGGEGIGGESVMGQVKIYGLREHLSSELKPKLSDVIHACVVEALQFPPDKRAHRFFPLEVEDFYYPEGRSSRYTIVEISMMEGREKSDSAIV
jgi:hypothetical protein